MAGLLGGDEKKAAPKKGGLFAQFDEQEKEIKKKVQTNRFEMNEKRLNDQTPKVAPKPTVVKKAEVKSKFTHPADIDAPAPKAPVITNTKAAANKAFEPKGTIKGQVTLPKTSFPSSPKGMNERLGDQLREVPVLGSIYKGLDKLQKFTEPAANVAQEYYTPGAGLTALGAAERGAMNLVSRVAPKLPSLVNRGLAEGAVGAYAGAGQSLAANPEEGLTGAAKGAGVGGLGGAALPFVGKGVKMAADRTGLSSALSKLFARNGMTDDVAAKEVENILALPMGRKDAANLRRTPQGGVDGPIVNPYTFALPEPKAPQPVATSARIRQRANPYRDKYNQLIGLAHETKFTPGKELEELESLWSQIADREDPNLDELIKLAHPTRFSKVEPGLAGKARQYQQARDVAGAPLPIKRTDPIPQGVIADAAPITQKVGRRPGDTPLQTETPKRIPQQAPKPITEPKATAPKEEVLQSSPAPRTRDRVYNFLDEQEKAARKRLASRRNIGFTPNGGNDFVDWTIIGAAKMGKGTIKAADWTEAMVKEFGEDFRKHAPKVYRAAQEELEKQKRRASKEGQAADEFNNSGKGDADTFAAKINYKPTKKQTSFSQKLERIRSQSIDDLAHFEGLEKRVNQEYGGNKKLASAEKSLYKTARLTKGIPERANMIVQTRLNPLVSAVEKAGFTSDDLGMYALAKHAQDVNTAGYKSGFTNKEIEEILAKYESPVMEEARQGLVKITRDMMQERVDAGVDSKELQEVLQERWKNYIPLFRALDDDAESLGGGVGMADKLANITSPVKKLVGSEQDVIDPLENLVKNIFQSVNATERNKVGLQLAELAKKDKESKFIRKLGNKNYVTYQVDGKKVSKEIRQDEYNLLEDMTREERNAFVRNLTGDDAATFSSKSSHAEEVGRKNVVNVKIDGENAKYEVEPDVYKTFLNLDKESSNMIVNILAAPASLLRAGATLTPEFSLRNPMRDVLQAFVTSKSGFNPFTDFFVGLGSTIKKGELYKDWVDNLGAYGNVMSMDRKVHREALNTVLKQPPNKKFVNVITGKSLIRMLRYISDTTESATKVGEYRAALRKGETKQEAAYRARDLMDFARAGSGIRQANKMVAFLNANIQGKSKLIRAIKEDAPGVIMRSLASVTVPTVGIYIWNHTNATETQRKTLEESPDWLKDSFWLIAVPGTEMIARIPKPFDLAPIFANLPERILKSIKEDDPKAFDGYARSLVSSFAIPTQISGLLPIVEGMANYSFFRESSIIPQREEGVEFKDQYDPIRTTQTAKILAAGANKITGGKGPFKNFSSPRIMDNTIQGVAAGLGQYTTSAVDSLLQGKVFGYKAFPAIIDRPESPQKRLEQRPLIKSFLVDPLTNSRSLDKFYDEREKLTKASGSAKLNDKKFEDSSRLKSLNKTSTRISKIGKEIREIEASRLLSPHEKRIKIEPLLQERNTLAKQSIQKG
ncbi:LPD38 domain-containing protein [Paenibacillus silvisoli]|uniref:LPD38 domain-containing protein n=1 Tax=Paenibacillus silvisoli TaxID=3110539 RepID=UPI002803D7B7|nr:LPD38 domain-containing protein [Paenibacillus silvisoli]